MKTELLLLNNVQPTQPYVNGQQTSNESTQSFKRYLEQTYMKEALTTREELNNDVKQNVRVELPEYYHFIRENFDIDMTFEEFNEWFRSLQDEEAVLFTDSLQRFMEDANLIPELLRDQNSSESLLERLLMFIQSEYAHTHSEQPHLDEVKELLDELKELIVRTTNEHNDELHSLVEELTKLMQVINGTNSNQKFAEARDLLDENRIVTIVQELKAQLSTNELSALIGQTESNLDLDESRIKETVPSEVTNKTILLENERMNLAISQLINKIQQLMTTVMNKQNEEKSIGREDVKQLLHLLREWRELTQQTEKSEVNETLARHLTDAQFDIWHNVAKIFEQRMFFNENQMYQRDAAITQNDVLKWLQHALNRYQTIGDKTTVQTNRGLAPVTPIEQYVVHVQQSDRVSSELIEKFQQVIRESRFLKGANERQLTIMLRPEHLGNMQVRLVQVNGEIQVKIFVTTQLAKEMLESNLHQLKSMFAPHQVSIERDETVPDEEFYHDELEEEKEEHDEKEESLHDEKNREESVQELDFQAIMEQLEEEVHAHA